MTLVECYLLVIQMWDWLAANPDKGKEDFILAHPEYPKCEHNCAACEYMCQKDRWNDTEGPEAPDCKFECPMRGIWPEGCCSGDNTAFNDWGRYQHAGAYSAAGRAAKTIANHAREKLAELQPPL